MDETVGRTYALVEDGQKPQQIVNRYSYKINIRIIQERMVLLQFCQYSNLINHHSLQANASNFGYIKIYPNEAIPLPW